MERLKNKKKQKAGRKGGKKTLALYGREHFVFMAYKRWEYYRFMKERLFELEEELERLRSSNSSPS